MFIPDIIRADPAYRAACVIINQLQVEGFQAYLVGGCVRDLLLGRTPNDFDVATSATPEEIEVLFPNTIPVGKSFGVITVVDYWGHAFLGPTTHTQVATFRKDGAYSDNRRPDTVDFCTLTEDVIRRDFTINGMAYDPLTGMVIDMVGGQEDLNKQVIRAIGNPEDRFKEDQLRILRAVRFSTTLDFLIERNTLLAIHSLAYMVRYVTAERVTEELRKIFVSPNRARGILLLHMSGILKYILPEVSACKGIEQPQEFHPEGDVLQHTLLCVENLPADATFTQVLATLLHDIGKPPTYEVTDRIRFNGHAEVGAEMAREICMRLRLTNEETEEVVWLVANHMKLHVVQDMRKSRLRRFLSEPHIQSLLVLGRADAAACGRSTSYLSYVEDVLEDYEDEPLRPIPFLRGQDLLDMGVPPGPIYSQVLQQVEDAQLEGSVSNYEEAIALAKTLL